MLVDTRAANTQLLKRQVYLNFIAREVYGLHNQVRTFLVKAKQHVWCLGESIVVHLFGAFQGKKAEPLSGRIILI